MKTTLPLAFALCAALTACQAASDKSGDAPSEPEAVPQPSQVDPADLVDCAATGRAATEFDCDRAERAEAAVERGVAAIEWPRDLKRGSTRTLYLTVGNTPQLMPAADSGAPDEQAPADADAPEERPGGMPSTNEEPASSTGDDAGPDVPDRETVPYTPLVGRFMSAELTGPGFEISPAGPVSQELPPNSTITWAWTVTPLRKGIQRLSVTTRVEFVDSQGDRVPLRTSTQRKDIDVTVSPVDQVRDWLTIWPDWLKLIGGLFTAVAGALAAWFGLRRVIRNRGETPKPDDEA